MKKLRMHHDLKQFLHVNVLDWLCLYSVVCVTSIFACFSRTASPLPGDGLFLWTHSEKDEDEDVASATAKPEKQKQRSMNTCHIMRLFI